MLFCDDDILENPNNNELHVVPPLGSAEDKAFLQDAIKQKILDGLMRDHHIIPQEVKEGCFSKTVPGTTGFKDTYLSLHHIQILLQALPAFSFWKYFLKQPTRSLIQEDIHQLVLQPLSIHHLNA